MFALCLMAQIIAFPSAPVVANDKVQLAVSFRSPTLRHLDRYQWHFGRDAYWFFVSEKSRLPDRYEAEGLAVLLGHGVKAVDGKYYGRRETDTKVKRNKSGEAFDKAASELVMLLDRLAKLTEGQLVGLRLSNPALNKNKREHIANQSQVVASWLALLLERDNHGCDCTEGRASSPDKRICSS